MIYLLAITGCFIGFKDLIIYQYSISITVIPNVSRDCPIQKYTNVRYQLTDINDEEARINIIIPYQHMPVSAQMHSVNLIPAQFKIVAYYLKIEEELQLILPESKNLYQVVTIFIAIPIFILVLLIIAIVFKRVTFKARLRKFINSQIDRIQYSQLQTYEDSAETIIDENQRTALKHPGKLVNSYLTCL
ncbi:Transmembrane domain-containing protein [Spironucleus salmonicida]|uniref:Transmembrane domain-containing protein n=1 Tax=Spironucleus salmonicida TaxID=348837 RepID=V6M0B5_9EUKA|nr:Transmembrane domain-containing protein [Spironucleus salmonicida]|eukprot:EST49486.1 Transmembrane domain-containing protein [Spironucleus salmonicida]